MLTAPPLHSGSLAAVGNLALGDSASLRWCWNLARALPGILVPFTRILEDGCRAVVTRGCYLRAIPAHRLHLEARRDWHGRILLRCRGRERVQGATIQRESPYALHGVEEHVQVSFARDERQQASTETRRRLGGLGDARWRPPRRRFWCVAPLHSLDRLGGKDADAKVLPSPRS
jgi:hypothetical protein